MYLSLLSVKLIASSGSQSHTRYLHKPSFAHDNPLDCVLPSKPSGVHTFGHPIVLCCPHKPVCNLHLVYMQFRSATLCAT